MDAGNSRRKDDTAISIKVTVPHALLRKFAGVIVDEFKDRGGLPGRQPSEAAPEIPKMLLVGHDVVVPRLNGFGPVADIVTKFTKVRQASEDVAIYEINRLSLWKAAELGMTADEVVESLKVHSRTPPKRSLRSWINRTMATYGAVKIVAEDNFNALEAIDEATMDRILEFNDVRKLIHQPNKRITPSRVRIIKGRRFDIKRLLIDKGYPVKDYGFREDYPPLKIAMNPSFTPWEHQDTAVKRLLEAGDGVVILPPGSGKTAIACMATVELQAPTLIFCDRAQICEQFKREYLDKTNIRPRQISVFHGSSSDRHINPVTITTYQLAAAPSTSASSRTRGLIKGIWGVKWGLIVFDEVQHIPADKWSNSAETILTYHKLGLTATPVREDKKEKDIYSLVGPPIIDIAWLEMAEEGFIANVTAYEVLVDMTATVRRDYNQATGFAKVIAAATNPTKTKVIKKLLEKHKDDPTLIIGFYIDGAKRIAKAINAPIIYGETPHKTREQLYQEFREGRIPTLVLTSVGEQGINLPNARVAINVAGLYGSRMGFSQRMGRILRPKKQQATFYEIVTVDTLEEPYSERRRAYLVGQGYDFDTIDMTATF